LLLCARMRGNIDAVQKNWSGAAFWFADAVKLAPSLPFAYTDWGAALSGEGNYDVAIERFRQANLTSRISPIRSRCGAKRWWRRTAPT